MNLLADLKYESLRAGTTKENSDSGAEVARKVNDNFKKVADKLDELDGIIQKGGTAKIAINGKVIAADEDGTIHLPFVSEDQIGLVQSSESEGAIVADVNGTMKVSSLNVNKLVQTDSDVIILDGGNADRDS